MKVCAITMVYKDYWALSQWYAHYSRHLGSQNLFIVAHGADAKVSDLCPNASIITVPREDASGFDRKRGAMLNSIQDGLAVVYDWVIRTDADELICIDSSVYADFNDFFRQQNKHTSITALGIELVEAADDASMDDLDSALAQRQNAMFTGHYSKAFAVKRGVHLSRHGIISENADHFNVASGAFLVHLKYANIDALQDANKTRTAVAMQEKPGGPGAVWRDAERQSAKFLRKFEALQIVEWDELYHEAFEAIASAPETEADKGIVRSKSVSFGKRTVLPDWFKTS